MSNNEMELIEMVRCSSDPAEAMRVALDIIQAYLDQVSEVQQSA